MKIAIIHDWFDTPGGAENVIENMLELYPDADLFSLVDFFSDENRTKYLKGKKATTSFIQKLPFASTKFRNYLALFPIAIEQFNLDDYDLVISSSHAVAKGVLTGPHQLHICYQYSPMRYAWDMYHTYFKEHNISGIKAFILRKVLHKIRIWDVISSNRVDKFVAISTLIQARIEKYYRRESHIIFPPVDTEKFTHYEKKEDFYFTAARLVPYKKVKLIVEAFNENGKHLKVAGSGEQYEEIKRIAKDNIEVLGYCSDEDMVHYMQKSKAFVYAAFEDFGIVPVEAMACGTPVIAYGKGGVLDTVKDEETGILFGEQSIESINDAVIKFETLSFDAKKVSEHAKNFSSERFQEEFKTFVDEKVNNFLLK
ncbi:MAG: glycosyltransferase [Sulfurovum sp.]|nr:glycosyltransferase [Sulfurovum sp.]